MKTIMFNGTRFKVAYIFGNEVIVELPKKMITGHASRMPVKFSQLSKRQVVAIRKLQSTV